MAKKEVTKKENTQPKDNGFVSVSENLPFHDFEKEPVFMGRFISSLTLGEKEPFIVNKMMNEETSELVFVTNAYSIEKCIGSVKSEFEDLSDIIFRFEFKGKTEINGKPFNKFDTAYKIDK